MLCGRVEIESKIRKSNYIIFSVIPTVTMMMLMFLLRIIFKVNCGNDCDLVAHLIARSVNVEGGKSRFPRTTPYTGCSTQSNWAIFNVELLLTFNQRQQMNAAMNSNKQATHTQTHISNTETIRLVHDHHHYHGFVPPSGLSVATFRDR